MTNRVIELNPSFRTRLGHWIESPGVSYFIIAVIVINAITLGMETSKTLTKQYGDILHLVDMIALSIFCLEIVLKLLVYNWRFFLKPWNVFDFLIVSISLLPTSDSLSILRALRVLRVLRLVSLLPQLRMVVETLLRAIPGIASIAALLLIIYYVFAVITTQIFGEAFPQWFGSLGHSLYTLFQIMTLESWSMGIVRPIMQQYPYAWLFFVPFILISTFTMLNLFIAVIVNSIHSVQEIEENEKKPPENDVATEIQDLRKEIKELKMLLQGAGR